MKNKIRIRSEAMNTDRAYACKLIFKLTYVFPGKDQPHLEIFPDDEKTRSEQWDIYGAKSEDDAVTVEFTKLQESKDFEIAGKRYRIEFTDLTEEEVNYPRGGKIIEPVYHFFFEAIN